MAQTAVQSMDVVYSGSLVPAFACLFASRTFFNDDGDTILAGDPSQMSGGYYRRQSVSVLGNVVTIPIFDGANALDPTYSNVTGHSKSDFTLGLYTTQGKLIQILFMSIRVPDTPASTTWEELDLFSHAVHQPMRRDYYDTYEINRLLDLTNAGEASQNALIAQLQVDLDALETQTASQFVLRDIEIARLTLDTFLANTAITDATQRLALRNLVDGLVTAGLWSKMKAIYPLVGGTATTHKFNLRDPRDLDIAYRITWAGTVTHNANGIAGDGSTGYGDTHLNLSALSSLLNNTHMSAYSRTSLNSLVKSAMGVAQNGVSLWHFLPRTTSGSIVIYAQVVSTPLFSAVGTFSQGMYTINRGSATDVNGTRNLFAFSGASPSAPTLPNGNVFLSAVNDTASGAINFDTRNYAWYSIGEGLTDQNITDLYTIVQAYQTALSRNV